MRREAHRPESTQGMCSTRRSTWPIPPPPRGVPPAPGNCVDDRRGTEGARAAPMDDKLAVLRASRRARGLCHTCGELWGEITNVAQLCLFMWLRNCGQCCKK